MSSTKHLKPYQFTSEQDRKKAIVNGRKGGIKSGISRRTNKQLKDVLNTILEYKISEEDMHELLDDGILEQLSEEEIRELDRKFFLTYKLYKMAMSEKITSVRAFETIRDTIGENPKDMRGMNINENIIINVDLVSDEEDANKTGIP